MRQPHNRVHDHRRESLRRGRWCGALEDALLTHRAPIALEDTARDATSEDTDSIGHANQTQYRDWVNHHSLGRW